MRRTLPPFISFALASIFTGFAHATCPADLNNDGVVDSADLAALLGQWNGSGSADLNGDGIVTAADLGLLLGAWGLCPDTLVITSCQPNVGDHGTIVTFLGGGFGTNKDNLCVRLMPEGDVACRVLQASGNTLDGTVTAVPAGAADGHWMMMTGVGTTIDLPPDVDFSAITGAWAWTGTDSASSVAECADVFSPVATAGCVVVKFQIVLAENKLVACLPGDICPGSPFGGFYPIGSGIEVDAHFDCLGTHYDCFVPPFTVCNIGADATSVAAKIATALQQCFNATSSGVVVTSTGGIGTGCIKIGHTNPDCIVIGGGTIKLKPPAGC